MSQVKERGKSSGKVTERGASRGEGARADTVEWVLGALSAAAVAAMIGFLLYQALALGEPVPEFEVTAGKIEQRRGAYYVEFRALNPGEATAAGVTVKGTILDGERSLETSEATLDYVPAQSARRGALLFRNDPNEYRLLLEVKGYREP